MKKLAAILMALTLALSLSACGGDKEKTPDASNAETTTAPTEITTESTTAPAEVSLVAKGSTCTITVPKVETFFDGYKGSTVKYNNPSPNMTVYVNFYRDDPKLEVNVSVTQIKLSSVKDQSAKGYAEYYNGTSKMYHYEPVEIAGFSGYLATSKKSSTDNNYFIDYPLSDGSSVVINLHVSQKYLDDTSEMVSVAEAFFKNIKVAPISE